MESCISKESVTNERVIMKKSTFPKPTKEEFDKIVELRENFLNAIINDLHLIYSQDVDRVINDNWQCHRFLLAANGDMNIALNNLVAAMKWRKRVGIRDITEKHISREFLESIPFCEARDGSTVIIVRAKYHRKFNELFELSKKSILFVLEYLDINNDGNGVTILLDLRDVGVINVDLELAHFFRPVVGKYYPMLIKRDIICEIPWIISGVVKLFLRLMSEEKRKIVKIVSVDELIEYLDNDSIPNFLGGTSLKSYYYVPKDSPSFEQIVHQLSLPTKTHQQIVEHLRSVVNDVNYFKRETSITLNT